MEQLQQVDILFLVKGNGWRDVFCAEGGVAAVDDVFKVCGGDLGRRDVEGEDLEGEVREGQVFPLGRPLVGEYGDFFGDEQTAVCCETLEDDLLERELYDVSTQSSACLSRALLTS